MEPSDSLTSKRKGEADWRAEPAAAGAERLSKGEMLSGGLERSDSLTSKRKGEADWRAEPAAAGAEGFQKEKCCQAVWSEATIKKDRSPHQPPCRELFMLCGWRELPIDYYDDHQNRIDACRQSVNMRHL